MKMKQPGRMLTEKIKEKDRQIASLLKYVDVLNSIVETQNRMIEAQEDSIKIQNVIITIYKS